MRLRLSLVLEATVRVGRAPELTLDLVCSCRGRLPYRCADADLSLCRLVGKASLALELLEVPIMEFLDALAASVSMHGRL